MNFSKNHFWRFAVIPILTGLLFPAILLANDPWSRGIDPVAFKLAPGDGFATIECPKTMPSGQYRLDLAMDGALGLLALRNGDEKIGDLVSSRMDLHLLISAGLLRWFEIGADVPVTIYQGNGFQLFEDRGIDLQAPASGGAGDIRLTAKVALPLPDDWQAPRAWEREEKTGGGWSAALATELRLPTGDENSFIGEHGIFIGPRAIVGWERPNSWRIAGSAGYRWRKEAGRFLNLYVGDEFHAGLAAAYPLPPLAPFAGWDAFGEVLMSTPAQAAFAMNSPAYKTPLELLAGLRFALRGGIEAKVLTGTGIGLQSGFGRSAFRFAVTLGWAWPTRPSERLPSFAYMPEPSTLDEIVQEPVICEPLEQPTAPPWVIFERGQIDLKGEVWFDTGKATLKTESRPVLDEIVDLLHQHPEIRKIRVDGHTDSIGSFGFNLNLSKQRAQTVASYIIGKGITEARVSFAGFGPTNPIDTNETPEGRERNRRVEITILEIADPSPPKPVPIKTHTED